MGLPPRNSGLRRSFARLRRGSPLIAGRLVLDTWRSGVDGQSREHSFFSTLRSLSARGFSGLDLRMTVHLAIEQ